MRRTAFVAARWRILAAILVAGLLCRLALALALPFAWRDDEVYQNLEPALRLLTGQGVVTWEWRQGIRSWAFPGFLAGIWKISAILLHSHSPFVVQAVLSVMSLGLVAVFMAVGAAAYGTQGAVIAGLVSAFWPDLVIGGSRTLVEVQGGACLALGVGLAMLAQPPVPPARRMLLLGSAGLLFGLATAIRFPLGPAAGLATLWIMLAGGRKEFSLWRAAFIAVAAILPLLLYGLLDKLVLGHFFQSIFLNFDVNINQHVAVRYGSSSVLYYLARLGDAWGAALLPIAVLFVCGARRYPFPAVVALAVILTHSLIAHKEQRFIWAAIPLILLVASLQLARFLSAQKRKLDMRLGTAIVLTAVLVFMSGYLPKIIDSNATIAQEIVVTSRHDACGVAIFGPPSYWAKFGGYAYDRHKVPLYFYDRADEFAADEGRFNYVLADQLFAVTHPDAQQVSCKRDHCIFKVAASCADAPDLAQFNAALARDGH